MDNVEIKISDKYKFISILYLVLYLELSDDSIRGIVPYLYLYTIYEARSENFKEVIFSVCS